MRVGITRRYTNGRKVRRYPCRGYNPARPIYEVSIIDSLVELVLTQGPSDTPENIRLLYDKV
jgi:hypothetical protein